MDEADKPTLAWCFDDEALAVAVAADGWYALLTILDPAEADAAEVLRRYKGQEAVERRYGNLKGPLAVAPMLLKSNRRTEALISVICLALLVFCLAERALRLAIAPVLVLAGLWAGRPANPPAGSSSPPYPGFGSSPLLLPVRLSFPDRPRCRPGSLSSSASTPHAPADPSVHTHG